MLGTVIGVGALVATIGLSKTAGNQIVGRFSEVAATDVVVTPVPGALGGNAKPAIPRDAETRARRLNGVAGGWNPLRRRRAGALVRSVPINDPLGQTDAKPLLKATTSAPGALCAPSSRPAAFLDAGHSPVPTARPCW